MSRTSSPSSSSALPISILSTLRSRKTDWEDHVSALQELTTHVTRLPLPPSECLLRQLSDLSRHLGSLISDLRSALVKETCLCIVNLVRHLGAPFVKATAHELIPALLKRAATTKAVISKSALTAAQAFFDHGVVGLPLQTAKYIAKSVQDRKLSSNTRAAAAQFVSMILVEDCIEGLADIGDSIYAAIHAGCTDPDVHVRSLSRGNWVRLYQLDPSFARGMLPEFDHNVSALLLREIGGEVLLGDNNVKISPGGRSAQGVRRDGVVRGAQRVAAPVRAEGSPKEAAKLSPVKVKNVGASRVSARVGVARNAGFPPRTGAKVERDGFGAGTRKVGKPVRPPRRSVMPGTIIGLTSGAAEKQAKGTEDKKAAKREAPITANGKLPRRPAHDKVTNAQEKGAQNQKEAKGEVKKTAVENVARGPVHDKMTDAPTKLEVLTAKPSPVSGASTGREPDSSVSNDGSANSEPKKVDSEETGEPSGTNIETTESETPKNQVEQPKEQTTADIPQLTPTNNSIGNTGGTFNKNRISFLLGTDITPGKDSWSNMYPSPLQTQPPDSKTPPDLPSPQTEATASSSTPHNPEDKPQANTGANNVPHTLPKTPAPHSVAHRMNLSSITNARNETPLQPPQEANITPSNPTPPPTNPTTKPTTSNKRSPTVFDDLSICKELGGVDTILPEMRKWDTLVEDIQRDLDVTTKPASDSSTRALPPRPNGTKQATGRHRAPRTASTMALREKENMGPGRGAQTKSGATGSRTGYNREGAVRGRNGKIETDGTGLKGIAKGGGQMQVRGPRRSVMSGGVGGLTTGVRSKERKASEVVKGGDGAEGKEEGKRRVCKEVQGVIEWMRGCLRVRQGSWEEKSRALGAFCEACKELRGRGIGARLAEDCVGMLGEFVGETHHRVVRGALDGLFYLLLCPEGSAVGLQRGLERHEEVLRRTLWLKGRGKEDLRLAAGRVLGGFEVQFSPEVQVCLMMRAMGFVEGGKAKARGKGLERRGGVLDGRLVEMGCAEVEKGLKSGQGFVWREELLEMVLRAMQVLGGDRRVAVRKSVEAVVEAIKQSLPEGAFGMACDKYDVRLVGGGARR
eukprot:GFKZ01009887.1.p1 GENE.GFKZ01009887.1~~GFKZ01009887.1.p1  ORF type:complete len:1085 (-),score=163.35 GFKZ01009887.1:368-3622(-)